VPSDDDKRTSRLDTHETAGRFRRRYVSGASGISRRFRRSLQLSPCSMRAAAVAARDHDFTADFRRDPNRYAATIGTSKHRHGSWRGEHRQSRCRVNARSTKESRSPKGVVLATMKDFTWSTERVMFCPSDRRCLKLFPRSRDAGTDAKSLGFYAHK